MIELKDICLSYGGRTILTNTSLTVQKGAHVAIMGQSGVGKTTLLNVIAGLSTPQSGSVKVSSERCAMLFQQPRLLPWCTAAENVNCVLSDARATLPEAEKWLALVGLGEDMGKYPAQLSGGMQQRVALARALAFGGDPVLLDEPFQGLDEATRAQLIDLCRVHLAGRTTVLVTHARMEASALAGTILTMHQGGILSEEAYG